LVEENVVAPQTTPPALRVAYLTAILVFLGGIPGVAHHYFWFGGPSFWLAIGGKLKDALEMAMRMEQDAIDFYQEILTGLFGSGELIGGIVEAEKGHLSSLCELASLERSKGV
jgi:rubrerythrin